MTPILMLESTGPKAEELAMEAGRVADLPVGYDPDLECATFDSDSLDGITQDLGQNATVYEGGSRPETPRCR